jgi:DNA-binding NarL/FixJ family response regulator
MATTTAAVTSAHRSVPTLASVAVVAADTFAARRIGASLESAGLKVVGRTATAEELVSETAGPHPHAVVLACDPFEPASLAAIRRLTDTFRTSCLVVVSPSADGVRQAVNAGADGVVLEAELEATLAPTTHSVLVGQISLPRSLHRCVVKPVFSHREKQVLSLVVRGHGNRQIADRLFLAESTIKSHLSTAFQKLGVRSRKEAAALLMDPEEGLDAVLDLGRRR